MASMELISTIFSSNVCLLSRTEIFLLEADFLARICDELKTNFKRRYDSYFKTLNLSEEGKNNMIEDIFIKTVIHDILDSGDYTLTGIAYYTNTPEEVVYDLAAGLNTNPSAKFLRNLICLHRMAKQDIYKKIILKITTQYSHEIGINFANQCVNK